MNILERIGYKLITKYSTRSNFVNYAQRHFQPLKIFENYPDFTYQRDGLFTIHSSDFIEEKKFNAAYQLGKATGSWGDMDIEWRAYIACWAASIAIKLDGDFVECGVNKGGLSRTVISYVDLERSNKCFFLFDTYNGLVPELISNEEKKHDVGSEIYEDCYEHVLKEFADFKNVKIIKGVVPQSLSTVEIDKVAYLSIDMNCVAPEIAAAEFFWDKLVSKGVMVLDDYGWPGRIEQKKAFDAFATKKGISILRLPTGQALIIKP